LGRGSDLREFHTKRKKRIREHLKRKSKISWEQTKPSKEEEYTIGMLWGGGTSLGTRNPKPYLSTSTPAWEMQRMPFRNHHMSTGEGLAVDLKSAGVVG